MIKSVLIKQSPKNPVYYRNCIGQTRFRHKGCWKDSRRDHMVIFTEKYQQPNYGLSVRFCHSENVSSKNIQWRILSACASSQSDHWSGYCKPKNLNLTLLLNNRCIHWNTSISSRGFAAKFRISKKQPSEGCSQQAHSAKTTSNQRWFNVKTLNQRWIDVVLTLCACWVRGLSSGLITFIQRQLNADACVRWVVGYCCKNQEYPQLWYEYM